jgi:hypothetical protein
MVEAAEHEQDYLEYDEEIKPTKKTDENQIKVG